MNINGLPVWVKVVATVGFPVAVTAFLLAQSAGWIPSEVSTLNALISRRSTLQDSHIKTTEDIAESVKLAARIMCINSARDEAQRRNCDNIR